MFDIGSYHNAVNLLEANSSNTSSRMSAPQLTPRAAQRRSHISSPNYESVTRRERSSRSHFDRDHGGDWVSVPINGEQRLSITRSQRSEDLNGGKWSSVANGASRCSTTRSHQSENLGDGWSSVPNNTVTQTQREYRVNSYQNRDNDNYDVEPLSNGLKSMSVGYRQQHIPQRSHGADMTQFSGSSNRYNDSYVDDPHRSTGSLYYNGKTRHPPRERVFSSRVMNGGNSFQTSSEWEETNGRPYSTKLIYDGEQDSRRHERFLGTATRVPAEEKQFLNEVQRELEYQRQNWKDEIEKMTGSMPSGTNSSAMAMKSSYVDTSGIEPHFKAFIDISEFPPSSVMVNIDKISNKIIVEAKQEGGFGSVAKTFTQKVQLPRFADDTRLTARMNRDGILKVEVPLIYYFPQEEQDTNKTKSFVYEVRENEDGTKTMEILVKPGKDLGIKDIRVGLDDNKLVVYAERVSESGRVQRQMIKKYTLPENANPDSISSVPTSDGCLTICVPIFEKSYR